MMLSSCRWLGYAIVIVSGLSIYTVSAASLAEWQSRSVYQILTDRFARPAKYSSTQSCNVNDGLYCGGTWSAIAEHLDYVQGMNFDAIWISPVVRQLPQLTGDGESYAGYWQQDLYALNDKFGTEDDLKALVAAAHKRGMYVMLDIVVNHVANLGPGWKLNVTKFRPFNHEKYFHNYCDISGSQNQTMVEVCYLGSDTVSLADLRTEDVEVQDMFKEWISSTIAEYSFDGLRIDTAINVNKMFFTGFVDAAGVFATGEVMQGDDSLACQWEETIGSILNYPIYYPLIRAFQTSTGSIGDLVETMESVKQHCKDPTALGSFSENHDVQRFASYTTDLSLARNIVTFTILADGIPIIYQGQEQHMQGGTEPYTNRAPLWQTGYNISAPLYRHVATLNRFRQHIAAVSDEYMGNQTQVIYQDYHTLAMRKGLAGTHTITVLNNNGEDSDNYSLSIRNHGYPSGTKLMEVLTCTNLTINGTGHLNLPMGQGLPKVLYPADLVSNSTLCGMPDYSLPVATTTVLEQHTITVNGKPSVVETTLYSPITMTPTTASTTNTAEATSTTGGTGAHDYGTSPQVPMILTILLTIIRLAG